MRRFLGFLAFLVTFSPPSVLAQGRIDCSALHSKILKRAVHYCVQVPGSYDKKDASGQESDFYHVTVGQRTFGGSDRRPLLSPRKLGIGQRIKLIGGPVRFLGCKIGLRALFENTYCIRKAAVVHCHVREA